MQTNRLCAVIGVFRQHDTLARIAGNAEIWWFHVIKSQMWDTLSKGSTWIHNNTIRGAICRWNPLGQGSARPSLLGQVCSAKVLLGQGSARPSLFGQGSARPSLFGQGSARPRFYSAKSVRPSLLGQVCSAKVLLGQGSARPSLLGQDQYLAKNRKYSPTKICHIRKRSAQIRNLRIIFQ